MTIRLDDAEATEAFGAALAGAAARRRRRRPVRARSARARRRWRAGCCAGSAIAATSPARPFRSSRPMRRPTPASRSGTSISTGSSIRPSSTEIGLDEARGEAALRHRMARAAAVALARRAAPHPRASSGGGARLDSRGAARLGGAMAAPMIPPAACARFPRRAWLGRMRDQAAGRRRQLPPLFPRPSRRRRARC